MIRELNFFASAPSIFLRVKCINVYGYIKVLQGRGSQEMLMISFPGMNIKCLRRPEYGLRQSPVCCVTVVSELHRKCTQVQQLGKE